MAVVASLFLDAVRFIPGHRVITAERRNKILARIGGRRLNSVAVWELGRISGMVVAPRLARMVTPSFEPHPPTFVIVRTYHRGVWRQDTTNHRLARKT